MSFWADLRKAMQRTIVAASGFDSNKVLWADQNADQPKGDYIDLSLSGHLNTGQDWVSHTFEEAADNGQQIVQRVNGVREATLSVEVFTDTLVSNVVAGAENGDDALAVVDRIRSAFLFDDVRAIGEPFGISWFDLSQTAEYIPKIVSAGFRGRAVWPVRLFLPADPLTRRTTFIETVEGRVTANGGAIDPETRDFTAGT